MASFASRLRARRAGEVPSSASPPPARDPASGAGAGASGGNPAPVRTPESQWFWDHYELAAGQVVEAFAQEQISLAGRKVADIGCGDGFIDLGVLHKAHPAELVGFDLNPTNEEYLAQRAHQEGIDASQREGLRFLQSGSDGIPAPDDSFELAFTWSAFEHVSQPVCVLSEINRILAPGGVLFLQLWPFYMSAKGSHLWDWYPEDHHHLQRAESEIVKELGTSDVKPADWTSMMSREFQHLNRITVDELQRSLIAAGLTARRVELLSAPTRIEPELARYSWLDLTVSGIKLIATAS
jgi:ubiquinone/menaquinone biosynthesis C-methylase UbiE